MYVLVLNRKGDHTYSHEHVEGLFYLAHRLEQLRLPFRFCDSPVGINRDETACFSNLLTNHTSIINAKAGRIIIGGRGAHAKVITSTTNLLQITGASTNIQRGNLEYSTGVVTKDPTPSNIEIPSIPAKLQEDTRIIHLNCGSGCFYGKCLFCERTTPEISDPELVAINICEIFKRYHCQIQLSVDGPSWEYLQCIATELIRLQPTHGKVKWGCSIRAIDAADYSKLEFLTKSGLSSIGVGVEYFCDDVLQTIQKGISLEDILKTFDNATKLNLYLHFCLIDFDPFVVSSHREVHYKHLYQILEHKYPRLSMSVSTLVSNPKLDDNLRKLIVEN